MEAYISSPLRANLMNIVSGGGMRKIQQLIVEDIVSGVLPFGARLTIDDLAARYGVSHMPIREALRELSGSGLLEVGSGRTARVREMGEDYIEHLFATRGALETMLTRRAAERVVPKSLQALRDVQEEYEAHVAQDAYDDVLAANQAFHKVINDMADNPEAVALVDQRWILMRALWARVGYVPERYQGVISDHRNLIIAISQGDAEGAGILMGAHVLKAKYELLAHLKGAQIMRVA
jgi:DNA-binding GntR family transcriptional regulator